MSVRITPKQTPAATPSNGTNDVVITVDDQGGGGSDFTAKVVAKYDPSNLTPTNISPPGIVVNNIGGGDSEVQWNNVPVDQDGTDFTFDSNCDANYNYACKATNLRTSASACQDLNMDCTGSSPGSSDTCD